MITIYMKYYFVTFVSVRLRHIKIFQIFTLLINVRSVIWRISNHFFAAFVTGMIIIGCIVSTEIEL